MFELTFGSSRAGAVGSECLVLLDISLCAGLQSISFVGVFRKSRIAFRMSVLLDKHFLTSFLAIFTADSAFPFDWLWYGDDVKCSNSHLQAKLWKSADLNWGPLSEMMVSGIPCRANCCFRQSITVLADVSVTCKMSSSKKSLK